MFYVTYIVCKTYILFRVIAQNLYVTKHNTHHTNGTPLCIVPKILLQQNNKPNFLFNISNEQQKTREKLELPGKACFFKMKLKATKHVFSLQKWSYDDLCIRPLLVHTGINPPSPQRITRNSK